MSTALLVFDRLMKEAEASGSTDCREHILEQAHWGVADVQQRMLRTFDQLVQEITQDWGVPEFNARTDQESEDEKKHPMPSWVTGSRKGESSEKILRLSYWRREGNVNYVLLRIELDSKDRPNYYNLVLGARKRHKTETVKVDKLRNTSTSFWSWIGRKIGLVKAE